MAERDLIENWKSRKAGREKAHQKLQRRLQREPARRLSEWAQDLHEEAFDAIDCLECGHCCSSIPPIIQPSDSKRIAKHLGMRTVDFESAYVHLDEDGDRVLGQAPCPFLGQDNYCAIYEVRPRACREYPHTDGDQFARSMRLHALNARYCPAVFHVLEAMQRRIH